MFRPGPVPAGSEGVLADLCEGHRERSSEEEEEESVSDMLQPGVLLLQRSWKNAVHPTQTQYSEGFWFSDPLQRP